MIDGKFWDAVSCGYWRYWRELQYSRIHKGCHPTGLHSVRNPKILTAGFKVKSKNKILKIPYLVKIRLMEELSRMRQLSFFTSARTEIELKKKKKREGMRGGREKWK